MQEYSGTDQPTTSRVHTLVARLRLDPTLILSSAGIVVAAAVVLLGIRAAFGMPTALSSYFCVLLLLAPAMRLPLRWLFAAAGWALIVAVVGYVIGEHRDGTGGLALLVVALVVVCLAQSVLRFGQVATISRSPVNLILFAAMPSTGAQAWQVVLGATIGAVLAVIGAIVLAASRSGSDADADLSEAVPAEKVSDQLRSGLYLAVGCLIIFLVAELSPFELPRAQWSLLAFCMILAVDAPMRSSRMRERIIGTIAGALAASALSALPSPIPLILAAICVVLCLAYIRAHDYTMYVIFLTPAVLLTSSGKSTWSLALEHVEAVLAAIVMALALTTLDTWVGNHRRARSSR